MQGSGKIKEEENKKGELVFLEHPPHVRHCVKLIHTLSLSFCKVKHSYTHFINEETEAQGGYITYCKQQSWDSKSGLTPNPAPLLENLPGGLSPQDSLWRGTQLCTLLALQPRCERGRMSKTQCHFERGHSLVMTIERRRKKREKTGE